MGVGEGQARAISRSRGVVRSTWVDSSARFLRHALMGLRWSHQQIVGLKRVSFGDTPRLADELVHLILVGAKTATCCSAVDSLPTPLGELVVFVDAQEFPKAVIRTTRSERVRFCDVSASFAWKEGEGDRSLKSWRSEHERFFRRNGYFSPDMILICEEFELVASIDGD